MGIYEESQLVFLRSRTQYSCNIRRSQLAQAERSQPRAHINRCLDALALYHTSEEASGKGITSTVCVIDLALVDGVNGECLDLVLTLNSNDGRVSSLGDDGNTLALLVLLWQVCEVLSDGGNVVCLEVVGVGV